MMHTLAKLLGIAHDDLLKILGDSDYGLEFKVYPNNQPSSTLKYITLRKALEVIDGEY